MATSRSARCRIRMCDDKAYDVGGLCPTHSQMASAIRAARDGQLSKAGREWFLAAIGRGY